MINKSLLLCPFGALASLIGRFSQYKYIRTEDCNDCGLCETFVRLIKPNEIVKRKNVIIVIDALPFVPKILSNLENNLIHFLTTLRFSYFYL